MRFVTGLRNSWVPVKELKTAVWKVAALPKAVEKEIIG
jgi:hypothetical protein